MNQQQRRYLIKKISQFYTNEIDVINIRINETPKPCVIEAVRLAAKTGQLKMVDNSMFMRMLAVDKEFTLNHGYLYNKLEKDRPVRLCIDNVSKIIDIPEKYYSDLEIYETAIKHLNDERDKLNREHESLISRITFCDGKLLEPVIEMMNDKGKLSRELLIKVFNEVK